MQSKLKFKTATLFRYNIADDSRCHINVYRLSPPWKVGFIRYKYVRVSVAYVRCNEVPDGRPVKRTRIMACDGMGRNPKGRLVKLAFFKGIMDHRKALQDSGYVVIENES